MQMRIGLGCLLALSLGAGLVVACGDDNDDAVGVAPGLDSGTTADTGATPPTTESDAGLDATPNETTVLARISPFSVTRIPNALSVYGSVFGSDGLLYASGGTTENGLKKLAVWRFRDGVIDTTFGTAGVLTVDVDTTTNGNETSFGIVEVGAGSFVVQAVAASKVWLVKLAVPATGAATFGTPFAVPFAWSDGVFTGWTGANPPAYSSWGIALDKTTATPKIVVFAFGAPAKADTGTQRTDNDRWIARVDADTFANDPGFNGGQPYSTDVDGLGLADGSRRGLVLADGSIVQAGYTGFTTGNGVVLLKLTPAGVPDPTFNFGTTAPRAGQAIFNPFAPSSGFAEAYGIGIQKSGRLVTTGYGTSNFDTPSISLDLVSFGVKADGLDATYGRLGAQAFQSELDKSAGLGTAAYQDRGRDLTVLADDRIVHAGSYDNYATLYVTDPNGKLDTSVGVGGMFEYAFPGAFFKVTASPDGKLLAATTESLNQTADAGAPAGAVLVTLKVGE